MLFHKKFRSSSIDVSHMFFFGGEMNFHRWKASDDD